MKTKMKENGRKDRFHKIKILKDFPHQNGIQMKDVLNVKKNIKVKIKKKKINLEQKCRKELCTELYAQSGFQKKIVLKIRLEQK